MGSLPYLRRKNAARLLQRTVLLDFPLFCPKCRHESIINARNFQIEKVNQPDALDAVLTVFPMVVHRVF